MPIITVQFIQDVVATPEQKRELVVRLTETFVSILGEVVRPFTYCLIQETPAGEWGIAGVPMSDRAYLIGAEHAAVTERANAVKLEAVDRANTASADTTTGQPPNRSEQADAVWRGTATSARTEAVPGAASAESAPFEANSQAAPVDGTVDEPEGTPLPHEVTAPAALERHRAVVALFLEAINQHDLEQAGSLLAPDFLHHVEIDGVQAEKEEFLDGYQAFFRTFSNWHFQPEFIVAENDRVAVRGVVTGTMVDALYDLPAPGQRVAWTNFVVYRLNAQGQIAECWQNTDVLSMQTQCGLFPLKV